MVLAQSVRGQPDSRHAAVKDWLKTGPPRRAAPQNISTGKDLPDAREPDQLGTSLDKIMGGFWIIVNELASVNPQTGRSDSAAAPSAFILRPSEDWTLAHRGRKTAVSPSGCSPPARIAKFLEAWQRIGSGGA
jgi:hypothetical protein